ncbi:MAG TPA: hypothetical protein VK901_20955 [Nitrospiraceae bacterium]|nr:hypothetical protein [Nitrospiraceae bacterium]
MKRKNDHELVKAFQLITLAASAFVNRAPKVRRIDRERAALLDVITDAELILSVHRLPNEEHQPESMKSKRTSSLEEQDARPQTARHDLA